MTSDPYRAETPPEQVDLDTEDIRRADGSRLTRAYVDAIIADAHVELG